MPWSEDEQIAFTRFKTPNQLGLALCSSKYTERQEAHHAMNSIQHVRNPITAWLGSPGYLCQRAADVLLVGFQESLTEDFEYLKHQLGLDESVHLPHDDVTAHRNPSSCDKHLDPLAELTIRGWYQTDYELIRICRALRSERSHSAGDRLVNQPVGPSSSLSGDRA